jgi:hypothetical protein
VLDVFDDDDAMQHFVFLTFMRMDIDDVDSQPVNVSFWSRGGRNVHGLSSYIWTMEESGVPV